MEDIYSLEEALATLEETQVRELTAFIDKYGEADAASRWLDDVAAKNLPVTPYSSVIGADEEEPKAFSVRVREQIDRLICGASEYDKERKEILEKGGFFTLSAVSVVSAWLGTLFGIGAGVLAPAILLLLRVIGKVGVNAYCANKNIY